METYKWNRASAPLPSEKDFDPFGGDLDAQCAWGNFGMLSLDQAYKLFTEVPEIYQEDFMFMGPNAFLYYFPVIDRYMREVVPLDEWDDCEMNILGQGIGSQLEGYKFPSKMTGEVRSLAHFVLSDVSRFAVTAKDQKRISKTWQDVLKRLD